MRQHVVGDDQVGRAGPRSRSRRASSRPKKSLSVGTPACDRRRGRRRRRIDARAPGCRARRSSAACSRRCSRSRPPGARPEAAAASISSRALRAGMRRAACSRPTRSTDSRRRTGPRAPRSRLICTRLQSRQNTRSSGDGDVRRGELGRGQQPVGERRLGRTPGSARDRPRRRTRQAVSVR